MIAEPIEKIELVDESRAIAALVTAFAGDSAVRWLYPDAQQYLTHFPDFARAFAGKAFEHDTADDLEGHSAAALWLPPNVQPDEAAVVDVLQRSVDEPHLSEMFSMLEQMPKEASWEC